MPGGPAAVSLARRQLARLHQIAVDVDMLDRAATAAPGSRLRSLDAVHLASAQLLGSGAVVTYDRRLGDAVLAAGLTVETPA